MYNIYALIIIFAILYLYAEIQCKILQEEETKLNYRLHFIIGILKELIIVSKESVRIPACLENKQLRP